MTVMHFIRFKNKTEPGGLFKLHQRANQTGHHSKGASNLGIMQGLLHGS